MRYGLIICAVWALSITPIGTGDLDEDPVVEMLSRIQPSDVEMIEVFRGPSELPGVFHTDGCAAIAIWTKWNK